MKCPQCAIQYDPGAHFCPACGLAFAAASQSPAQSFGDIPSPANSPSGGPQSWMPLTGTYLGSSSFQQLSQQPSPLSGRVAQNLQALGVSWCVWGLYRLVFGLCASVAIHTFAGHNGWWGGDDFMPGFLHTLIPFITITTALMAGLSLCVGYGLLSRRPWARPLGIIMSVLALLKIPLGTALGAYTLWVLAPRAASLEYEGLIQQAEAARGQLFPRAY